uniref:Clc-like protein n=1 Tax=Strongyloides stercoralis TaxID=6248 RepID=A0AAF5DBP8_STRER
MASTVSQKVLLVLSIIFIVLGLALTLGGAFSPAWQIVDIREFRAEHQHGLWWDCVRAEKHVVAVGDFYDETPLHCMQKFDRSAELVIEDTLNNIDEDGAAGESEHHRFWAWHKIVLFFILFGAFSAFISICTGVCAPCFPPCAFVFSISLFIAMICSMIADGVFFLAANRVDNRFVQGMVGTYEQNIGYAFYIHLFGTLAWILAFICTLATTYKFFSTSRRNDGDFYSNNDRFGDSRGVPIQRSLLSTNNKSNSFANNFQYTQPSQSYQQGFGSQSYHFRETSA